MQEELGSSGTDGGFVYLFLFSPRQFLKDQKKN